MRGSAILATPWAGMWADDDTQTEAVARNLGSKLERRPDGTLSAGDVMDGRIDCGRGAGSKRGSEKGRGGLNSGGSSGCNQRMRPPS
jgi:hypothetical protein